MRLVENNNTKIVKNNINIQKRKEFKTMKKLFVPAITLVACLTLTYTTTAYASQEDPNAQVTPLDDSEDEYYPFDPYNN